MAAQDRLASLVRVERADDAGTHGNGPSVLDRIAASAAAGSPFSLELLLGVVVEHRLAGPAIGRVIPSPSMIEDVEQEVMVAVAHSVHGFRGTAKFTTWLYSLARNVAIAHVRRHRATAPLAADDILAAQERRRMSSQLAQRHVVRRAIGSLPPTFRHTVYLRDIAGLSYAEIADRQGLELNTVRSRLSRGRAMLAGQLSSAALDVPR